MKLGIRAHPAKYVRINAGVTKDRRRIPLGVIELDGEVVACFNDVNHALFFGQSPMLAQALLGMIQEYKPTAPLIIGGPPTLTKAQEHATRALALYLQARKAIVESTDLSGAPAIIQDRQVEMTHEQMDQVLSELTGKKAVH